ncbi:MAG: hypothetical protein KJO24_04620, partial [Gammaproteobacteria bacterium]|nr:hypothetical protein [Gammaproteobacteria bacterium]
QRRSENNLHKAIQQLPQQQADVLQQIYLQGKTQAEVAQSSGLPLGTVKSRVRLALEKLRVDPHISSMAADPAQAGDSSADNGSSANNESSEQ